MRADGVGSELTEAVTYLGVAMRADGVGLNMKLAPVRRAGPLLRFAF